MAAAGPGNASFPAAAGSVPSAVAAQLWPSNATQLTEEVAAELGLVANATTAPQASSRGGTPGWTTGLLAALISVAVIVSMITVFVLIHRNLRRQRREVLESFLAFQEAETAALEAGNAARQRLTLACASRAAAVSQHPPREPPMVVVQPDMSPSLCIKDNLDSRAARASDGSSCVAGSRYSGSLGGAGAGEESRQAGVGPGTAAAAAAAAAAGQPGEADLEAAAAHAPRSSSGGTAAAVTSLPAAPAASSVQRLALAFPGLGATVLLLLPSGPQSAGLLLWDDGSGASVLPGASWRGWGPLPPHAPAPVFQSDIELVAQQEEQQQEGQQQQQQQQQGEPSQQAPGPESKGQERQDDRV